MIKSHLRDDLAVSTQAFVLFLNFSPTPRSTGGEGAVGYNPMLLYQILVTPVRGTMQIFIWTSQFYRTEKCLSKAT